MKKERSACSPAQRTGMSVCSAGVILFFVREIGGCGEGERQILEVFSSLRAEGFLFTECSLGKQVHSVVQVRTERTQLKETLRKNGLFFEITGRVHLVEEKCSSSVNKSSVLELFTLFNAS